MTTTTTTATGAKRQRAALEPSQPIIECWPDSDIGGFLDLPLEQHLHLLDWIYERLRVGRSWCMRRSSYNLKHLYEDETRRYVTNAQFKDAMILSGYRPKDRSEFNHHYRIHPSSPAFMR